MRKLSKIIVVVGPTASGKTDLGIFLAKKFGGEIVNADSRQIYKEMDIGTGKPEFKNQKSPPKADPPRAEKVKSVEGVLHHLFDIAKPSQVLSVAEWKGKAIRSIRTILRKKKLPIIVGGTGLYIRALVENLEIPSVRPNLALRAKLERELAKKGIETLYQRLLKLDPESIHVVDSSNPRRIIRAIEVCLATHKPFSAQQTKGKPLFDVLEIGLMPARSELYQRIDKRIDSQFKAGLVSETKRLLKKYPRQLPAMTGIGYGEVAACLDGTTTLAQATERMKFRTHGYARRQLTWFRKDKNICWIEQRTDAVKLIKKFLSR